MGYYVSMDCSVKIHKSKKRKLIELLNAEVKNCSLSYNCEDKEIKDAFKISGYSLSITEPHYYYVEYFLHEKLGDDEIFWTNLAPAIEDGCFIDCSGEDNAFWQWRFSNGEMTEHFGRIVYEEELDTESPYDVIGISPSATKDEIIESHHKKLQQYNISHITGLAPDLIEYAKKRIDKVNSAKEECLKRIVAELIRS